MLDPIAITVTDVSYHDEGVAVDCLWRQGDEEPNQIAVLFADWPKDVDHVRRVVSIWVHATVQDNRKLNTLRSQLMAEDWEVPFVTEGEPVIDNLTPAQMDDILERTGIVFPLRSNVETD